MTIHISRRRFGLSAGLLAAALVVSGPVSAQSSKRLDLNLNKAGVAIHGYDPVAYFTVGKPVKGSAAIAAKHDGATYHFSSAANKQAFLKAPAKYKPAYGGYCAIGASFGKKFDGRPDLWKIVDGRLYLNVAPGPHKRWLSETKERISIANANWPKIKSVPTAVLNAR